MLGLSCFLWTARNNRKDPTCDEVDSDGNYEYKFRVANTSNGQTVNIFEGDYTVKIFKVVYLNPGLSAL